MDAHHHSEDTTTFVAKPGLRFVFVIFAVLILGVGTHFGQSFFATLMIFSGQLVIDFWRFNPRTHFRKGVHYAGITLGVLLLIISVLGLVDAFQIVSIHSEHAIVYRVKITHTLFFPNGAQFPLSRIWDLAAISIVVSALDWVTERREIQALARVHEIAKQQVAPTAPKEEDPK